MSPLTKTFVVLVTLLSVVFVALVIPMVAKTDDYKSQVATLKTQLAAAQAKAAMTEQDIQNVYAKTRGDIASLTAEKGNLQSQIDSLTAKLKDSEGSVADLRADLELAKADASRLTAASQQQAQLLEDVTKDSNSARQSLLSEKTKSIQLEDALTKANGEVANITRQLKRMREAMVALEEENRKYAQTLASMPQATTSQAGVNQIVFAPGGKKIQGQVQAVERVSDVTLALVNIGTSDGVKENMKFNIHRNGNFVGNLIVETVDTTDSSGRITLSQDQIRVGDQITAAAN